MRASLTENRLAGAIRAHMRRWMEKRMPPTKKITLTQKNIFIAPDPQAIYYFVVIILLWIAATNYENNLAFALSFLMIAVFLVGILHTFNNMSGLIISALGADPVFEGEYAEIDVLLATSSKRNRDTLLVGWENNNFISTALIDIEFKRLKVPVLSSKRGLFNPGRLTLKTTYPLGIIRSWTHVDLDCRVLTYPKPVCFADKSSSDVSAGEDDVQSSKNGSEEFDSLKSYYPGAQKNHIAWKQLAKGQGLNVKEYVDYSSKQLWLDWDDFPALGIEERLSTLCYWALEAEKENEFYGLRIPGLEVEPGHGVQHRQKVLRALAMHGGEY